MNLLCGDAVRPLDAVIRSLETSRRQAATWCGRRTWLLDGSSSSMPDMPELPQAFGQPGGQDRASHPWLSCAMGCCEPLS
jgi:hypothetical protein